MSTALFRAAILCVGWWILSEGDPAGVGFGVAVVAIALVASLALSPPPRLAWKPLGLLRYAAFFVKGSLHGGFDVAHRALAPRLALAPAVIRFRSRLPAGPALDLFTSTMSLMPGTLAVDREGSEIEVHTLFAAEAHARELELLEECVGAATGVVLGPEQEAGDG